MERMEATAGGSAPPPRCRHTSIALMCVCLVRTGPRPRIATPRYLLRYLHLHDTRVPRLRRTPTSCACGSCVRVGFVLGQRIAVPR